MQEIPGVLFSDTESAAFGYHRDSLGFEVMSGPIYTLSDLGRAFMFVEICCSQDSSFILFARNWEFITLVSLREWNTVGGLGSDGDKTVLLGPKNWNPISSSKCTVLARHG